ncbi:MAG: glycosyltransferase family 39 protein [Bacteroidota bacterium]
MSQDTKYAGLLAILGAIFFIPYLGAVHLFDWDEINFAEISREMLITEEYLRIYVNFEPFWEKPPLFFWLQSLAMQVFGINAFSARFPNAICGILTLVVLFYMGRQLYHSSFGFLWAGIYLGTILPNLYFRSGIIDPFFNLFIFVGLYFFLLFYWKKEQFKGIQLNRSAYTYLFLGGFIVGLGILTKGPVAYLVVVLCFFVYWLFQRLRLYISIPQFLFFSLATTLVTLSWYGLETWKNGSWFISEFNKYQYRLFSTPDAGHRGFPAYHFVVLLVGCFPASIFTLRSFFGLPKAKKVHQQDFQRWMAIFFWVVLILFSIVQSKIVHYSSLCYFPLTYLAAICIQHIFQGRVKFNGWMKLGLMLIGGLYVLATLIAPYLGQHPELLIPLFNDPFAQANLEANVVWTGWEVLPGIFLLLILFFSLFRFGQNKGRNIALLFGGTALFITLTLFFYINRIEGYSQNAAISFFKSKVGEDCYILPMGYKSYGHLFYAQKPPVSNPKSWDKNWLLTGEADKPVYFITKIHRLKELEIYPNMEEIGRKNGFVFLRRNDL